MDGTTVFPLFRQRAVPVFVIQELVTIRLFSKQARIELLWRTKTLNAWETANSGQSTARGISIRDLMKYVKRSEVSWDGYGYCSRQEMRII